MKPIERQQRNRENRRSAGLLPLQTVWHRRARLTVLTHYSGGAPCCACCGEKRIEFLAIDHIEGKGGEHRSDLKQRGTNIYHFLKKNNFPPGYRVLCHNCNQSFGLYGYCPHQSTVTTDQWLESLTSQKLTRNTGNHQKLTINGETKTVKQWSISSGRKTDTIRKRLARKLSPREAVFGAMRGSCDAVTATDL